MRKRDIVLVCMCVCACVCGGNSYFGCINQWYITVQIVVSASVGVSVIGGYLSSKWKPSSSQIPVSISFDHNFFFIIINSLVRSMPLYIYTCCFLTG